MNRYGVIPPNIAGIRCHRHADPTSIRLPPKPASTPPASKLVRGMSKWADFEQHLLA